MVEQVVGLEFVTSGEREIVSSIARVDSAQKKLQATSNALAQAQKRNAGSEEAVIKAYLALERSGLSYSDVLSGLRQDSQMAQKSAQQYNNALLGVDKAHKSAKSSADVFRTAMKANETALEQQAAETKQAAAADAALAREKDRLIQKLNPLRSASMLYEKELRDINEATRLGAINDRQRQQSLDALNAEFQAFSTGAQGAAMANNRFGVQSQMAARQTNQLGVLMQQTGYQVGDFAVQVQGGTNVMVALGQQATQLVGTFGMLAKSTRMIGVFAGLGILIPIVTGVAAAFMRMRESADEATKEITREVEKLSQAIGSLNSIQETTAASFDANLNSVFGETAESVSNLLAAIKEVRFENAMLPVQQTVDTVRASVDAAAIQMNRLVMLSQQSPTFRRFVSGVSDRDLENIKASVRANIDLVNAQDEVRASLEAITDSRSSKELIDNFASALTLVESIGGPAADDLQNALIGAAKEAGVYEEIIRQTGSATEDVADAAAKFLEHQKGINDLLEAGRKAEIDRNRTYMSMMREKRNEMAMQAVINQYGQDSVQVAIERARQEAIVANLTAEQRDNFIAAAVEAHNLADAAEAQAMSLSTALGIVEKMAGVDLSGAFDKAATAVDGLNTKLGVTLSNVGRVMSRINAAALATVGTQAQTEALRGGATEPEAAIAGELAMERARIGSTANPATNMTMLALEKALQDQAASDAALKAEQDKLRPSTTPSGGGRGQTPITENVYLEQLRQEVEQKRRLSSLSEEQRSIEERVIQLQGQAQGQQLTISNERLRFFAIEEQRIADQMRLQDVFSSNIDSALMSLVQGTQSVEDAFNSMLRNIILAIYKQQVVDPIAQGAGSFLSSLFFANGAAFSNGNVVPFANGGVVGSPTTFPMAGGKTGLMGEAGPEAIMPLKRGRDGKLGVAADGGGAVTVNNYFTVQANGDDSVKRIVRQQIPQIAEATKAAVVDAKRRGGSYGRAFG